MKKRSITLVGHKTSIALEDEFWQALEHIANKRAQSLPALISHIDSTRQNDNLSSAIRVFALRYFQTNGQS